MNDLEKLKSLDPEEIYKKTFIVPKVVKSLIEGNYQELGSRTKALGFVTILERELGLDLSELKEEIGAYFSMSDKSGEVVSVKEKKSKRKSFLLLWFVVAFVTIFAIGSYWWLKVSEKIEPQKDFFALQQSSTSVDAVDVNETTSSSVTIKMGSLSSSSSSERTLATDINNNERISVQREESNLSESNGSVASKEGLSSEEIAQLPTITIIPKRKIWIGIIYLDNYEHKDYIASEPIKLDTSRDQLIVTGHGLFKMDVDGNITEYNDRRKQRLLYRAGIVERIDRTTFRQLNRGKDW